ncbi:NfeD family protein [Hyphococcus flavus]|uniref:NfeD family protein n=1 Tax=Hyphococcus flavus TaxID=1866326 RepID=A0AAE9ZHR1_9PROT|nr:NfeD family protein [Hyphococcus flavus]WDI32827.1 NfeD family protein [Hyphococcus flavus]
MIEIDGLPSNPMTFFLVAGLIGFGGVALAKLYGLIFMRWKTPFRVGEVMAVNRAEVVEWNGEEGYVSAGGELWRATSKDALSAGDKVKVSAVDGLLLKVRKHNA